MTNERKVILAKVPLAQPVESQRRGDLATVSRGAVEKAAPL